MSTPLQIAQALRVGDQVGISARYEFTEARIVTVTRTTKTLVETTAGIFKNGYEANEKYRPRRLIAVEEAQSDNAVLKEKQRLNALRSRIETIEWKWASKELLEGVIALLDAEEAKPQ